MMRLAKSCRYLLAMAGACMLLGGSAEAQTDDLLRWVPPSANALVLIDVDGVLASNVAEQEGWGTKERLVDRPVVAPQSAERLVLAALINPQSVEPIWEAAVFQLREDVSLATIAKNEGGHEDTIGDLSAAWSPRDAYFVQVAPRILGIHSPGNRQSVARWMNESKAASEARLSPYLRRAAGFTDSAKTEIIMALDLENAIAPDTIRDRIESSSALKGSGLDNDSLVHLLAGLQGVTLGIQVGDAMTGSIRVDFAGDAAPLAKVAKPLLLEALARNGAAIPDFESWKSKVQGKTIRLDGKLSTSGLRRLLSIIELPAPVTPTVEETETPASTPVEASPSTVAAASMEHFKGMTKVVDDLGDEAREARTIGQIGVWCDRYARKIDRLPLLNVDEDLLASSAEIAELLRRLSLTIRGIGIDSAAAKKQSYGYYGSDGRRYQAAERRAAAAPIEAAGAMSARDQWSAIEGRVGEIRRQMSERYQTEF